MKLPFLGAALRLRGAALRAAGFFGVAFFGAAFFGAAFFTTLSARLATKGGGAGVALPALPFGGCFLLAMRLPVCSLLFCRP